MRKLLIFILIVGLPGFVVAQKSTYQGLFLYQFSKYVKWPETYGNGSFTIDVFGDDEVFKNISEMAAAKKETQGMNLQVRRVTDVREIGSPHIVFVQNGYSNVFDALLQKVKTQPILIVTENPGLGKRGAIINFVEKEGKMRFELNQSRAESIGLKVSGSLISLAIVI